MGKVNTLIASLFIACSCTNLYAIDIKDVQLTDVHHPGNDVGHPCGHPSVSYDDDEITIKSDSTIYDVSVVVKDQYGNVMHQSTQTVGSEGTVIYVPDTGGVSEKTTIDLYYDRKHLSGYFDK